MKEKEKNPIGVMQGRLLPKYQNRYQAHPVGSWQKEFEIAASLKLDCIEFILDFNDAELNPLLKDGGIDEILAITAKTGTAVQTVCADYFMEAPLHSPDPEQAKTSSKVMRHLLENGKKLNLTDVVIPCVDQASIADSVDRKRFYENLLPLIDIAESCQINLSLETDLPPDVFASFLEQCKSQRVTVNYDIGNSSSLGYNPEDELNCYGHRISDIHIKDRLLGGGSVELGSGNAKFDIFFSAIAKFQYRGPFIMQAFRDDQGVDIFKKQLDFALPYLRALG